MGTPLLAAQPNGAAGALNRRTDAVAPFSPPVWKRNRDASCRGSPPVTRGYSQQGNDNKTKESLRAVKNVNGMQRHGRRIEACAGVLR